jgi:hypothetical protein
MTKNLASGTRDPRRPPPPYATARWLAGRGLSAPGGDWKVTIGLGCGNPRVALASDAVNTRVQIVIDSFEWSVLFCHGSGSSWIRVLDAPRIHERDDFGLLPHVTDLRRLGMFIQSLERRFQVEFRRPHATIHTNLVGADQKLLLWVVSAL